MTENFALGSSPEEGQEVDESPEEELEEIPPPVKIYEAQGPRARWRACLGCKLLLNVNQFQEHGCPNCPQHRFEDRELDDISYMTTASYISFTSLWASSASQ